MHDRGLTCPCPINGLLHLSASASISSFPSLSFPPLAFSLTSCTSHHRLPLETSWFQGLLPGVLLPRDARHCPLFPSHNYTYLINPPRLTEDTYIHLPPYKPVLIVCPFRSPGFSSSTLFTTVHPALSRNSGPSHLVPYLPRGISISLRKPKNDKIKHTQTYIRTHPHTHPPTHTHTHTATLHFVFLAASSKLSGDKLQRNQEGQRKTTEAGNKQASNTNLWYSEPCSLVSSVHPKSPVQLPPP